MVGYRSIIQLGKTENAVRVAHEQFHAWITALSQNPDKGITSAEWNGSGVFQLGPSAWLTAVEHSSQDRQRLLLELSHEDPERTVWTTRVVAHSRHHSTSSQQYLLFEGQGIGQDGRRRIPDPPRLVRHILEATNGYDGLVPIHEKWHIVRDDEVEDLFRYITDDNRHLSIIVAATVPGVSIHQWVHALNPLTNKSYGCATFFAVDEATMGHLNALLGKFHQIPAGAIRTFVPVVETGSRSDGLRHRILTARTLEQNLSPNGKFSRHLATLLSHTPRRYILEASLNKDLSRTIRVLENLSADVEQIVLIDAIPSAPPSAPPSTQRALDIGKQGLIAEASSFEEDSSELQVGHHNEKEVGAQTLDLSLSLQLIETFMNAFDVKEVTAESIEELAYTQKQQSLRLSSVRDALRRASDERNDLRGEVDELRDALDTEKYEHWITDQYRKEAEQKVRSLEYWRSTRPDRFEYVPQVEEFDDDEPNSLVELVQRFESGAPEKYGAITKYVVFSDLDRAIKDAEKVDEGDSQGGYPARFWEYVLVLRDYAIECLEHGFSGSVHDYLNSDSVRGRKCPTERHKANESESVQNNSRARRERTFRVPETVVPEGKMFMRAHFAPTHRDRRAPRMYYYADLENTKKIYIGYLGVHLTNSKTN